MILYGTEGPLNHLMATWAGERLGVRDWGPCQTIGVMRNDAIVAVAVFNHYVPPNIEISFVTTYRQWATPLVVRTILGYPFRQLGCKRITSTTEATNQRARAFLCRLGFKQEGYHPDALPSGDAVSFGLLVADAARWLGEEERGQVGRFATSGA